MITIAGVKLRYSEAKELRKRLDNVLFGNYDIRDICIYTKEQAKDYMLESLCDVYEDERLMAMRNGVSDLLIVSSEEFVKRIDIECEIEATFHKICINKNEFYVLFHVLY